ncbi:hypothetical protein CERSUDRAFT_119653 [Gelatoporia subvermispora B]|uniref:Uncharacterized protein n=1 Tax=Ceriporiopsis subvermispora (strain B) TaxID=914234 RepID=M2P8B0_CERS8|nr:hypothetical protein CERSUDRAFT_119653 [Gelatoporia subvermispora B]
MANWVDFVSLIVTLSCIGGIAYGLYFVGSQCAKAIESTKQSLKNKGVNVSKEGISVKTSRHLDREAYMDATQRSVMKALKNSQFGRSSEALHTSTADPTAARPILSRQPSKRAAAAGEPK